MSKSSNSYDSYNNSTHVVSASKTQNLHNFNLEYDDDDGLERSPLTSDIDWSNHVAHTAPEPKKGSDSISGNVENVSEAEAWEKRAPPTRLPSSSIVRAGSQTKIQKMVFSSPKAEDYPSHKNNDNQSAGSPVASSFNFDAEESFEDEDGMSVFRNPLLNPDDESWQKEKRIAAIRSRENTLDKNTSKELTNKLAQTNTNNETSIITTVAETIVTRLRGISALATGTAPSTNTNSASAPASGSSSNTPTTNNRTLTSNPLLDYTNDTDDSAKASSDNKSIGSKSNSLHNPISELNFSSNGLDNDNDNQSTALASHLSFTLYSLISLLDPANSSWIITQTLKSIKLSPQFTYRLFGRVTCILNLFLFAMDFVLIFRHWNKRNEWGESIAGDDCKVLKLDQFITSCILAHLLTIFISFYFYLTGHIDTNGLKKFQLHNRSIYYKEGSGSGSDSFQSCEFDPVYVRLVILGIFSNALLFFFSCSFFSQLRNEAADQCSSNNPLMYGLGRWECVVNMIICFPFFLRALELFISFFQRQ